MTKTKQTRRRKQENAPVTQEQIDREDAKVKDRVREKDIQKSVAAFRSILQKNEDFQDLPPEKVFFVLRLLEPKDTRPTMKELAEELRAGERTLYEWLKDPVLIQLRRELAVMIYSMHTPDIIENHARLAKSTSPDDNPVPAIKLWYQFFEDFKEASRVDVNAPPVFFGFPQASQFIHPSVKEKPRESLAQKNTKQVRQILAKKGAKRKSVASAAKRL